MYYNREDSQGLSFRSPKKFASVTRKDVTIVACAASKVVPAIIQVSTTYHRTSLSLILGRSLARNHLPCAPLTVNLKLESRLNNSLLGLFCVSKHEIRRHEDQNRHGSYCHQFQQGSPSASKSVRPKIQWLLHPLACDRNVHFLPSHANLKAEQRGSATTHTF